MLPSLQEDVFPWLQAEETARIIYPASEGTGKNCIQERWLHKQGQGTVVPSELALARGFIPADVSWELSYVVTAV